MKLGTVLRLAAASLGARETQAAMARVGRLALAARTVPAEQRRAVIASRLPVDAWPDRRLLITAIAADTGEFVAFDRDSGVPLVDAVAASCAVPGVWPPAVIDGRPYIDGGMRSPANVDLAAGADQVVVVAPIAAAFRRAQGVAAQVAALRRRPGGERGDARRRRRAAIGRNVLDPARRAGAAGAGHTQAASIVAQVAAVWRD